MVSPTNSKRFAVSIQLILLSKYSADCRWNVTNFHFSPCDVFLMWFIYSFLSDILKINVMLHYLFQIRRFNYKSFCNLYHFLSISYAFSFLLFSGTFTSFDKLFLNATINFFIVFYGNFVYFCFFLQKN
ncbi:hypothetical protein EDEG_02772 [Edhazardia aedis USNM 41457]|uniref:Uncharacterized protein n=1 Tax=Edhazardia aedis (strain USNM 41457) TaxID=1003232 RepID=J9D4T8_EDHAE|nr:hypothetical protein EDEG_02772 [Edhazardia aedis USNM 41457]|eukprot:EJW02831.1 hypothetical protein EDEG_02772 [Edhazardia aedis USNM 41457]